MNNKITSDDTSVDESVKEKMSETERVFIGAIGAAIVGFSTYPAITGYWEKLILTPDFAFYLAFLVRLAAFVFIGGFWAYLHKSENNRMKVFQTGCLAPAMLAGIIYANAPIQSDEVVTAGIHNQQTTVSSVIIDEKSGNSFSIISPAYAQSSSGPSKESFFTKFVAGLWGR